MDNGFLFWSLFFPRIVLLVYWLENWMPFNFVPFAVDVVLSILVPRALILIYIYQNMGADNGWFVAHLVFFILSIFVMVNNGTRD